MIKSKGRTSFMAMWLAFCPYRCVGGFSFKRLSTRQLRPAVFSTTPIQSSISDSTTELVFPDSIQTWLDIQLPEGRCVGVSISDLPAKEVVSTESLLGINPHNWMHSVFHPQELAYGVELSDIAASSFWLGRLAMRKALNFPDFPILKDSDGRPLLRDGMCGSISHKGNCGVALVSNTTIAASVGVDLEFTSRPGKRSIAPKVLTLREQKSLGCLPGVTIEEEVLLRFSLKEAIYKATHPLLCQYVSFQEAEVFPHSDGTASCVWYLESGADKILGDLNAHWRRLNDQGFFLTSASVQRVSDC